MNFCNRHCCLAAVAAVLASALTVWWPAPGWAQNANKVYDSTSFERQSFVAGLPLLGLDGWSPAIPPFLNPAAAIITSAASKTGRQSVEVRGGNLLSSSQFGVPTPPYDAIGSYRRPLGDMGAGYTVTAKKPFVTVEADLLLATTQPPTANDFFSMTIAARSGDGTTLGEIGLSSSGHAIAYDYDAAPGSAPLFSTPIPFNQWQRVSIVMDFSGATTVVGYLVNGTPIGVMPTTNTSDLLLRGAMVVYALPNGGASARANYTARFDNFQVSVQGH